MHAKHYFGSCRPESRPIEPMMIKNVILLALVLSIRHDYWADGASGTRELYPNLVSSPQLAPYEDVIGGGASDPAHDVTRPPYCAHPPPANPASPAAPSIPPPAGVLPPSTAPAGSPPANAPTSPVAAPPAGAPTTGSPTTGTAPPDAHAGLWCVANPTVESVDVQAAMDYACGSGADCSMAAPGGPCYLPDTLMAHASFAFNSYWQRAKAAGGTCDFAGSAMLITKDPSYNECRYAYM
ncbi:hypothetical protein QYE76_036337 [Lolium multiflorum]|uniref:X8 domain-containing protein n=1 Tax=Lolium multiflorum TaxID=4521 RepID=A0AAD8VN02_LOLMU|nr:hypothetical protein QYE76_036337 [Lolium multiflorum]